MKKESLVNYCVRVNENKRSKPNNKTLFYNFSAKIEHLEGLATVNHDILN